MDRADRPPFREFSFPCATKWHRRRRWWRRRGSARSVGTLALQLTAHNLHDFRKLINNDDDHFLRKQLHKHLKVSLICTANSAPSPPRTYSSSHHRSRSWWTSVSSSLFHKTVHTFRPIHSVSKPWIGGELNIVVALVVGFIFFIDEIFSHVLFHLGNHDFRLW